MKKLIIYLLCCVVLVSMVGCGGNTAPPPTESPTTTVSETVITEPPLETIPPVTAVEPTGKDPVTTEREEQVTEPEPTEKPAPFDIDNWIAYARSYAENKGLVLSDTAVDCWDNPIRAGTHCIYLERDIQSRLDRYAKDGDITDVWIWAEAMGNDRYDIYIGYA